MHTKTDAVEAPNKDPLYKDPIFWNPFLSDYSEFTSQDPSL